jgi:4-aminobutyrate aminotransferase / (S)-3-amino-2-methylpropionate transaminase / 5-aminovalerate transaminase
MNDLTHPFSLTPVDVPKVETAHRRIQTALPVPESLEILNQIHKYESSNVKDQLPVIWDTAKGHQIFDKWGNAWIDFTSTIFVTNTGHGHPHLVKAIKDQADKLLHAYSYPTEIRARYLEKLISMTPDYLEKASLYSAGTEATERAVKLARYHGMRSEPRRSMIVAWDGNFHGKTMGAQIVGGQHADKDWIGYHDPNVVHIPFPFPWVLEQRNISGAQLFEEHLKILFDEKGVMESDITAFMAETFQGWGALFYPTDYIQALRQWSQDRDILLIFDEIQAGFGRCGTFFAYEHYDVEPDLVCCGKGVSGSLPLSVVLGRGDIINLDPAYTSTHGGHPMACAAGLANLEIFEAEDLVAESARKETIFWDHIEGWRERFPNHIGRIYGKGCLFGVFVIRAEDPNNSDNLDTELCDQIVEESMRNGVFLIRTGRGTLKFGPPLNIPDEALVEALDVIESVIDNAVN